MLDISKKIIYTHLVYIIIMSSKKISSFIQNLSKPICLSCTHFMEYKNTDKYDLIVTNPPYFVCKKDYFIQPDYKKYIQDRANIFGLFIIH